MKQITYRELQTRFPKELPVIITKYGIPYAKITKLDFTVNDTVTSENINKNVTVNVSTPRPTSPATEVKIPVKCALPGCTKEATELGYIWHDEDWVEKLMCESHAKKSRVAYKSGF